MIHDSHHKYWEQHRFSGSCESWPEKRATPRNRAEGIFGYEEMAEHVLENTAMMT